VSWSGSNGSPSKVSTALPGQALGFQPRSFRRPVKIADAEVELAREWAKHFEPESKLRNGLSLQLEQLNRCGASSDFELALAHQQSLLAQAKWSAALQDVVITEEQKRFAIHLSGHQEDLSDPGQLSATERNSLLAINQLYLHPRSAEIAGLQAAATMASIRGEEFESFGQYGLRSAL